MIRPGELVVDNFAGGGGASTGIEQAIGRACDIAINHDPEALAMHAINHPKTLHLCEDVWAVDILKVVAGRPVGLAWFSPDCKHFSKAKGGRPVKRKIRGLAWVALKWMGLVRPRMVFLENVEEFQDWGPVVDDQPDKTRKGQTFRRWVRQIRDLGYALEWRELRACDYGAPTIRKRLFIIARCDGQPIVWPEATHGPGLKPYRTAAECIDWTLPCPSIFLTRAEARVAHVNRPLAPATMERIARGVRKYVLEAQRPFIVNLTHGGRVEGIDQPIKTITSAKRGVKALVVPTLIQTGYGERAGQKPRVPGLDKPLGTLVSSGKHALVSTFLARHFGNSTGGPVNAPAPTTTPGGGGKTALVAATIMKMRGTNTGHPADEPLHTISGGGTHFAEVRAFLIKYYGTDQDPQLDEPLHTITSKHRFGLVTVEGQDYQIVDIGMRMLSARELFRAQGFPEEYEIETGVSVSTGNRIRLTKTAQIRMCGNSVSPYPASAIVRAQLVPGLKVRAA